MQNLQKLIFFPYKMPKIHIEDKHTYASINTSVYGCRIDNTDILQNSNFSSQRYVIKHHEPYYPVTGTDESNRIGRKIFTSSLITEGFLRLFNTIDNSNVNTIYDVFTFHNSDELTALNSQVTPQQAPFNTNEQALDVSIRHMFVEFDDSILTSNIDNNLHDWFTQTFIQTGSYNLPSNRTQMLRESTRFTGDFKILYDKVHHLTLQNPIVHYKEVIPFKRNWNFDGTGSGRPTGKFVIELFIGPYNIFTDYGSFGLGQWISNNNSNLNPNIYVAELSTTLKLKYTDI